MANHTLDKNFVERCCQRAPDATTGWAEVSVGNVALALDHGKPFQRVESAAWIYLPLILKD